MTGLIEHMERHLGKIEVGWSKDADGSAMPFQIIRFGSTAVPGCVVFSTLGLSSTALPSLHSDKTIRHEFIMILPERLREGPAPSLLSQVGLEVLTAESAVARGDVIGPRGPLFETSKMEALYATVPVYLQDDFGQFNEVVLVWLVPVSRSEVDFVTAHGWLAFENQLADVNPDLTDLSRLPIFA